MKRNVIFSEKLVQIKIFQTTLHVGEICRPTLETGVAVRRVPTEPVG